MFDEEVAMPFTFLKLSFNFLIRKLNWPLSVKKSVLDFTDVLTPFFDQFFMRHLIPRELAKKFIILIFLGEYEFPCAISETILLLTNVNIIFIV